MKVGVLGSGNGGCAVALDWARAGHEVALFDLEAFPENLEAVASAGGIHAEGQLEGFAQVAYAGHDIRRVVDGAELVFAVGPAYSTRPFGDACKGHLKPGQTVVVCPGSCGGAVVMKRALGLDLQSDSILVAETSTLPYAVRLMEPGRIHVYLRLAGGVLLAALPGRLTGDVLALTRDVYPMLTPARNVLQTALQNANPVIHPAVTLLNTGRIEQTGGDFCFYEDGVTPAVGRLMEAVDRERIALGAKLGLEILPDPVIGVRQGYMQQADYEQGYARAKGFRGIKAQSSLDHRYFHEDVGYGLVFMSELGRQIGVATPIMDAVIELAGTVMARDYREEKARTLQTLGLGEYTPEVLAERL